jgi:hypothetical protein
MTALSRLFQKKQEKNYNTTNNLKLKEIFDLRARACTCFENDIRFIIMVGLD